MPDTKPTQIIILGGGGDLSQRKLFPALFDLYLRDMLPKNFSIIGLARSERTDEDYQTFVQRALATHGTPREGKHHSLQDFCNRISYVSGSFSEENTYKKLSNQLNKKDAETGMFCNRLFYLAVPPAHYESIFTDLKKSGVTEEKEGSWTHILVEKPFGNNYQTAQALDVLLGTLYREDQIFRIDHYLAKEAVQNILSFRFANTLLRAAWNKDSVESITITMTETIDVGTRQEFYEEIGALRDVGQNHLLQLLALTIMREPEEFTPEAIRNARTEVLQALKPISTEELSHTVLRAQYEDYKKCDREAGTCSDTETYFELKTEVLLPEWEGVPIYIRSGKALDKPEVSITITLHDITSGMFKQSTCTSRGNVLKLTISPEQEIAMTINAKEAGLGFQLEPRTLSFICEQGDQEIRNSYEKVLYDSIKGHRTLFTRTEEVLAAWNFITPIIEQWQQLPLYTYQKGSAGPKESIIPKT